ncbi:hypothetical protein BO94DRAFT_182725 [Aspergillus sclerotioniger CBS 115572]|uniref:Uncharacterized protein n=1 Tax=Aspergillus sclerotioniger CBS 115572 TaxID=1450535 RepID=A0A317W068_9EURO|nr:hypothetical protein BO94DRAFT_182725 [Aspergillus sclerotioniger CBS 115572]PWY78568.1 hypothetical protein BO94DRAFT_182725 [Aspergillus sclerotioniger CBS 115572]
MAPIRRYLRISSHTILECRIYLDNPSDVRWLLNTRGADPILPRIFAAIRPLVHPKLREENERLLFGKKTKGRVVKDVVSEEDFEVALFLRESRTRHSLLTREKVFGDADGEGRRAGGEGEILIESDDEDHGVGVQMQDIPHASDMDQDKRVGTKRQQAVDDSPERQRVSKRRKDEEFLPQVAEEDKKMRFRTNYEGFNIYGWVLCLLVTRKGDRTGTKAPAEPGRQVLMEEWISTQAQGDLPEE